MIDARRRRLLFRATHRGTKEADWLVGGYVEVHLAGFSEAELDLFERLLELPDPWLAEWLTGMQPIPADHEFCATLETMRRFAARGAGPLA